MLFFSDRFCDPLPIQHCFWAGVCVCVGGVQHRFVGIVCRDTYDVFRQKQLSMFQGCRSAKPRSQACSSKVPAFLAHVPTLMDQAQILSEACHSLLVAIPIFCCVPIPRTSSQQEFGVQALCKQQTHQNIELGKGNLRMSWLSRLQGA